MQHVEAPHREQVALRLKGQRQGLWAGFGSVVTLLGHTNLHDGPPRQDCHVAAKHATHKVVHVGEGCAAGVVKNLEILFHPNVVQEDDILGNVCRRGAVCDCTSLIPRRCLWTVAFVAPCVGMLVGLTV